MNQLLYRCLIIISFFCIITSSYTQTQKPAFDIRAWVLLDYNMPYLRRMIPLAAKEGINHLQLCHRIGMQLSDYLEPERNQDVRELIELAHSHGIKVYVWTHELDEVPNEFYQGRKIAAYGNKFWEWMGNRYKKLIDALPDVDGVVVTLTETKAPIDDDNLIVSPLTPSERLAKMSHAIYDVLKPQGKELILRTFTWIEEDYNWMLEAFLQLPEDIIIMTKVNWGDWFQHFPSNPFIGAVSPHPQMIEYDLVGQYHGDTMVPWVCAEFLQKEMQYGLSKDARGVIARVDWGGHVYNSANEFNAVAFAALAKDPFIQLDALWLDWASEKYSTEAAPYVVSALKRTNDIANLIFFTLSFKAIQSSSTLMPLSYMDGTRIMHSLFCRDVQARWKPELITIADELLNPTRKTLEKALFEKEEAVRLINASLNDLKKARPHLTSESFVYLTTLFQRAHLIASSWRWINEAYFRYLLLKTGDISHKALLESALEKTLEFSKKVEHCFGNQIYLLKPQRMRDFVNDIRIVTSPPIKWFISTNLQSMRKPLLLDMNGDNTREIIINTQNNAVHAFRAPGIGVWNYETFGLRVWYPNISDPVSTDLDKDGREEFMIGAADGILYTFSNNGELLWQFKTGNGIIAAPVTIENEEKRAVVVCASLDDYLYGLRTDGVLLWKMKINGIVDTNPVIDKFTIYIATKEGVVKAVSASGELLWEYKLLTYLTGALSLHTLNGEKVISASAGKNLIFIDMEGKKVSSFSVAGDAEHINTCSRLVTLSGEKGIIVGTDKGNLWSFSQDGNVIFKKELGYQIRTPVEQVNESMIILGVDNAVVVLNAKGDEIWRFTAAHDAYIGNSIVIDNKESEIIFTALDRKLYVIKFDVGLLKKAQKTKHKLPK